MINNIENRLHTLGILQDFTKTFHSIKPDVIEKKLPLYDIRELGLDLIKSYFLERFQYVDMGRVKSNTIEINTGIPQGSMLEPVYFLLDIYDIINISNTTT